VRREFRENGEKLERRCEKGDMRREKLEVRS
jgi:hypothetical protein